MNLTAHSTETLSINNTSGEPILLFKHLNDAAQYIPSLSQTFSPTLQLKITSKKIKRYF